MARLQWHSWQEISKDNNPIHESTSQGWKHDPFDSAEWIVHIRQTGSTPVDLGSGGRYAQQQLQLYQSLVCCCHEVNDLVPWSASQNVIRGIWHCVVGGNKPIEYFWLCDFLVGFFLSGIGLVEARVAPIVLNLLFSQGMIVAYEVSKEVQDYYAKLGILRRRARSNLFLY